MADMSPEAVGQRLELTGRLCETNFRLMNSRKKIVSASQNDKRAPGFSGTAAGETELVVGTAAVIGSESPVNSFAVVFEDDRETGYFYALDSERESPVLDAMHIYNVENVRDKNTPSVVQFKWSNDGLKAALLIDSFTRAVFDFAAQRGYCRTGFPPATYWSRAGHEWSDEALSFFQ